MATDVVVVVVAAASVIAFGVRLYGGYIYIYSARITRERQQECRLVVVRSRFVVKAFKFIQL